MEGREKNQREEKNVLGRREKKIREREREQENLEHKINEKMLMRERGEG